MKTIYRISDQSYPKNKIATKEQCFKSFLKAFPEADLTVICDNCSNETVAAVKQLAPNVLVTNLGNAGAVLKSLEVISDYKDDEVVYLLEDDYLHRGNCTGLFEEGLLFGDYATLFDYIDKYLPPVNGEFTRVFRGKRLHWRWSISTTMTVAAKAKTFKDDLSIWTKHCTDCHPHDHYIFCDLTAGGRRLCVAIPGQSVHVDMTPYDELGIPFPDEWALNP